MHRPTLVRVTDKISLVGKTEYSDPHLIDCIAPAFKPLAEWVIWETIEYQKNGKSHRERIKVRVTFMMPVAGAATNSLKD